MSKQLPATIDTNPHIPELGERFFNCAMCLALTPTGQSPRSWKRLDVAFTSTGLQVWCVRHNVNVAHIEWKELQ